MSSVSRAGRDMRMHVKNVRVYCEDDYTHQNLVMTFVVNDTVQVCNIGSYCQATVKYKHTWLFYINWSVAVVHNKSYLTEPQMFIFHLLHTVI
jgi:hypothetical protein